MNVLITGATSGIGRELAIDYAKAGNAVVAVGRNQVALDELEHTYSGQIHTINLDVSDKASVREKLSAVPEMDLVILNAGTCEYVDVMDFKSEPFERVLNVNFLGVVYCVEVLLDRISKGGQLAIVGSLSRQLPFSRAQAYGASKIAIHYFTKSLAVDLEGKKEISIHSISPGFVKTPLTDQNDFDMPFLIETQEASKRIIEGLKKGKKEIAFPRRLAWPLALASHLPESWQHKILLSLRGKK